MAALVAKTCKVYFIFELISHDCESCRIKWEWINLDGKWHLCFL